MDKPRVWRDLLDSGTEIQTSCRLTPERSIVLLIVGHKKFSVTRKRYLISGMGASVSANSGTGFLYKSKTTPDWEKPPTVDPNYGFEAPRKERVMLATEAELVSAKIPAQYRDYCAHLLINFKACRKDKFPFVYRCHHERHEYEECQYQDYILRMKEFERERRLLERKERKAKKAEAASHHKSSDE